jgi:DNA-binding transcriptional LysR family regulator
MKNASFRQLRVFTEVSRHLSFARAAEALHLSAPAVTMHIKELERNIGLALFHREGKKVSLTTTGEYMLLYARKILATVKDAEDAALRLRQAETGVLIIGIVGTAQYFMMKILAEFRRKHQGVELRLVLGNREQLIKWLDVNEVDIAIMGRPPKELQSRAEPFAAHPHVFVSSPQHALAGRDHLTAEDLRDYEFIVRELGSGTRVAMEKFFADARVEPRLSMELNSNETLKEAVKAGLGLGFLSLHTIHSELKHNEISILDIEATPVIRAWNVVHTRAKMLSPAAEAFRYFMLEHGEAYLASMFGQATSIQAA